MTNDNAKLTVLGIDLAKQSFQLHGIDKTGNVVIKKKVTRAKLVEIVANLSPCLVGMEACGGAHYWAKCFQKMGHNQWGQIQDSIDFPIPFNTTTDSILKSKYTDTKAEKNNHMR